MIIENNRSNILYRKWQADKAKAVFLLVHGLGGHSGRWESFAQFFLQHQISSYAIELKGFGETKDKKGHVRSLAIYVDDIFALRQIITDECPGVPIFLVGESLGGLISFLSVTKGQPFAGLICLSPAFKSIIKFTWLDRIKILFAACFDPEKQFVVPFSAQMCTRDSDYQMTIENDTLEHRVASASLLTQILLAQIWVKPLASAIKIPVLFLLSQRDLLVDFRKSQRIFKDLRVEDKTIIQYPNMYHALSIDLEKKDVFQQILDWAIKRC